MNWMRQDKRLAVFLRDGLCCVWCGAAAEDGARLTLDHVIPHSLGGSNHETNVVTSCFRCNSSRGTRSLGEFAKAVAGYVNHGVTAAHIVADVKRLVRQPLGEYREAAKRLIANRGSAAKVLAGLRR